MLEEEWRPVASLVQEGSERMIFCVYAHLGLRLSRGEKKLQDAPKPSSIH
jgi:hypothetical protein